MHRYFAYICYDSKDADFAVELYEFLVNFKVPGKLQDEYPTLPSRFTHVCCDSTELAGRGFGHAYMDALAASKYLIVICSGKSAGAGRMDWVGATVEAFVALALENRNRVIPIVLRQEGEGVVQDYLPPIIKELGILCADTGRYEKYGAFYRVAAALLDVPLDMLEIEADEAEEDTGFQYHAFISYDSRDEKEVREMYDFLTDYKIPKELLNGKDRASVYGSIKPIFFDQEALPVGGDREKFLRATIRRSRFLIPVCTANSVQVKPETGRCYVREVSEYVLETLKWEKGRVVPIIFREDATERAEAYMPRVLHKGGITAADTGKTGKEYAFCDLIAGLLQIPKAEIRRYWDRDHKPHTRYYEDCVMHNNIPAGIYELTEDEAAVISSHYRIVTLGKKVLRATQCDATGMPIRDGFHWECPAPTEPVRRATEQGSAPAPRKDVRSREEAKAGYMVDARHEPPVRLPDLQGLDGAGKPACTEKEGGGYKLERDASGAVVMVTYTGADGLTPVLNEDLWATMSVSRDVSGNIIGKSFWNAAGAPCLHREGYARIQYRYDARGNEIERAFYGVDNKPCNCKDGYSKLLAAYNAGGELVLVRYYDANGNLLQEDGR